MIRYLLAVALLVAASCVPALAVEPVMKADPAYGVRYAQEQIVTLPQDQEMPYLTLFGNRNDPKFLVMVKWFETNETLIGIKNQTHFNVIYSDMAMYRDRYASTIPALPCVRLQAVNEDQPVVEYSGIKVPMTADALAKGLNTSASNAECFRRRCPKPQPQPKPPAPIHIDQPVQPLPPPTPKSDSFPWLLFGVLTIVGGALGAKKYVKDTYRGCKV